MAVIALLGVGVGGGAQAWGQDGRSEIVIDDPRVVESSGLAVSPLDGGLLYTVNDSGNAPVVYVIDRDSGDIVGATTLDGVDTDTDDLEALAVAERRTLWVADTGDNGAERSDTALYALPAPGLGDHTVTPARYPLSYAGGPVDVEALLVNTGGRSDDRRAWLVTKGVFGGDVLALPTRLRADEPVVPEPVTGVDVPGLVTDGTVLPCGGLAVLRTYTDAYVYRLPDWLPAGSFVLPRQEQGESLAAVSGTTLLAGSEGSPALVDEVPLPEAVAPGPEPTTTEQPASATGEPTGDEAVGDDESALPTPAALVTVLVAVGAVVLATLAVVRRRRG